MEFKTEYLTEADEYGTEDNTQREDTGVEDSSVDKYYTDEMDSPTTDEGGDDEENKFNIDSLVTDIQTLNFFPNADEGKIKDWVQHVVDDKNIQSNEEFLDSFNNANEMKESFNSFAGDEEATEDEEEVNSEHEASETPAEEKEEHLGEAKKEDCKFIVTFTNTKGKEKTAKVVAKTKKEALAKFKEENDFEKIIEVEKEEPKVVKESQQRTVAETSALFKQFSFNFGVKAHRESSEFYRGKAEAYELAAFELDHNCIQTPSNPETVVESAKRFGATTYKTFQEAITDNPELTDDQKTKLESKSIVKFGDGLIIIDEFGLLESKPTSSNQESIRDRIRNKYSKK